MKQEKINIIIGIIVAIGCIAYMIRDEMLRYGSFDYIDFIINVVFCSLFILSIALPIGFLLSESNKKSKK